MERNETKISDWLIKFCHIEAAKAKEFEEQIKEKCWTTSVEILKEMLLPPAETTDLFDSIQAPDCVKNLVIKRLRHFNNSLQSQQSLLTSPSSSVAPQLLPEAMSAEPERVPDFGDDGANTDQISSSSANVTTVNALSPGRVGIDVRSVDVTYSEANSLHQQAITRQASKPQPGWKELIALHVDLNQYSPTPTKVLRSSTATRSVGTDSSSRSRPLRASASRKPDYFVAEPAVCTNRVHLRAEEKEEMEVEKSRKKRSKRNESVQQQTAPADEALILRIRAQTEIIKAPTLDIPKRMKAVIILSELAAHNPENSKLIQRSGGYTTMLDILSTNGDGNDELLWKTMIALNNTTAGCDASVVRHLVDGGVVPLTLPHCYSICTKVRMQALWMIGNIGASECKSEVTTPAVVKEIVQTYPSSENLPSFKNEKLSCHYAHTLQILTKDCSPQHARMMIPFIPISKSILKVEKLVEAVEYVYAALSNLLNSKENMIVDQILKANIVETILPQLLDSSRIKIMMIALNFLIDLTEFCNCEQMLKLEPVLAPLFTILQNCNEESANEKATRLAIDCIGGISQKSAESVTMVMRVIPTIYGMLMRLVQDGLKAPKLLGVREDKRTIHAASALMRAVCRAVGDHLTHFIKLGCYPLALAVMQAFSDEERVQETIGALSSMVKLQYVSLLLQQVALMDRFNVSVGWAVVRDLARKHRESNSQHIYSPQMLQNSVNAENLLQSAIQLGFTE